MCATRSEELLQFFYTPDLTPKYTTKPTQPLTPGPTASSLIPTYMYLFQMNGIVETLTITKYFSMHVICNICRNTSLKCLWYGKVFRHLYLLKAKITSYIKEEFMKRWRCLKKENLGGKFHCFFMIIPHLFQRWFSNIIKEFTDYQFYQNSQVTEGTTKRRHSI